MSLVGSCKLVTKARKNYGSANILCSCSLRSKRYSTETLATQASARVAAAARARVNKKMRKQTRELRVQKPFVELSGRIRSLCEKTFQSP